MVVVAGLEAVALVAVVFLLLRHFAASERAWADERRELLNRVQRPDHIPLPSTEQFVFPEQEDDELNKVGTIAPPPED